MSQIIIPNIFGTENYKHNFFAYFGRTVFLLLPGAVIGYYIDQTIKQIDYRFYSKKKKYERLQAFISVILQTLAIVIVMYVLQTMISHGYTQEFITTIPGAAFMSMFFGVQRTLFQNVAILLR